MHATWVPKSLANATRDLFGTKVRPAWLQKLLSNATWDPFGTKTRPDGLQDAHPHSGYPNLWEPFCSKVALQERKRGPAGTSNGSQNAFLRLDWHLDRRKMRFWEWCLKTSEI